MVIRHELEGMASDIATPATEAEMLFESIRIGLAAQGTEPQPRQVAEPPVGRPVNADDVIEFITVDDEIMADLDAVATMSEDGLLAVMAVADQRRAGACGLEAVAERTLEVTYGSILEAMRDRGTPRVGDIVGGRADVYRVLTAAIDSVVATASGSPARD